VNNSSVNRSTVSSASATSALVSVLLLASGLGAQSFSFPSFASVGNLTMNGTAGQVGSVLRVTDLGAGDVGAAWYSTPVSVAEGFETEFVFRMSSAPEGMAFVIQGSPAGASAMGGDLWGLGYGFGNVGMGIANSIAIEIDAMQDGFLSDSSSNEVSIHTLGVLGNSENEGASIGRVALPGDLSNNNTHTMRLVYIPGTLEVFIDTLPAPVLSVPFTFESGGNYVSGGSTGGLGLAGPDAWVGFTSTNSSPSQFCEIQSWNWISQYLPDACYVGNVLQAVGGPYDVLTVNNSTGGPYRVVRALVADPWSVEVVPPPGELAAPFVLTGTLGIANAATVTVTPFGNACFPPNVIGMGVYLAPQTFQVPPGLALNLDFTLQAVMATSSINPAQFELSNAVGMSFLFGPAPTITSFSPSSAVPGTALTLFGANFSPFVGLSINGVPVTISTSSANSISFFMPANVACDSVLQVRNPDGSAAQTAINPTPVITNQTNAMGPAAGGTTYVVIGQGLALGSTMTIGGNAALVLASGATSIVVRTPPGVPGPAAVVITTPGGCQVTSTFTYF
jgi:hypothetical protein